MYSRSQQEHLRHLEVVLRLLDEHKLYANHKKCQFGRKSVEYFGHVISEERVSADTGKIQAMVEWREPRNIKEFRGFLGLTGYYRKFVKDYGHLARPLTTLLKKERFLWEECRHWCLRNSK